jgi:hypothetical protein
MNKNSRDPPRYEGHMKPDGIGLVITLDPSKPQSFLPRYVILRQFARSQTHHGAEVRQLDLLKRDQVASMFSNLNVKR